MNNTMNVWMQTRLVDNDYGFLGSAPPDLWWLKYDRCIDPSRPGAAIESTGNGWRIYLTGVFSVRKDSSRRKIRYTLVVGGSSGDQQAIQSASAIVGSWLGAAISGGSASALSERLDEQFDEPTAASLLQRRDPDAVAEVTQLLQKSFEKLPEPAANAPDGEPSASGEPSTWAGDVHGDRPREQWLACATALLRGSQGRALVVNLLSSTDDLDDEPVLQVPETGALAILLTDSEPPLGERVRVRPRPGVTIPKAPRPHRGGLTMTTRRKRITALIVIAAILCALGWIIRWLA